MKIFHLPKHNVPVSDDSPNSILVQRLEQKRVLNSYLSNAYEWLSSFWIGLPSRRW